MKVFNDHRGSFILTESNNCDQTFISLSKNKYTFRGLHYQSDPFQIKTVKILQGTVLDFIVDLETHEVQNFILTPDSNTFTVSEKYAHGFLTLAPDTIVVYEVTGKFNPSTYSSIPWHSIKEVKEQILNIVGEEQITITDKDNYGTKGID